MEDYNKGVTRHPDGRIQVRPIDTRFRGCICCLPEGFGIPPTEKATRQVLNEWYSKTQPEQIAELVLEAMMAIDRAQKLEARVEKLEAALAHATNCRAMLADDIARLAERLNDAGRPLTPTQQAMADALQEIADDR